MLNDPKEHQANCTRLLSEVETLTYHLYRVKLASIDYEIQKRLFDAKTALAKINQQYEEFFSKK